MSDEKITVKKKKKLTIKKDVEPAEDNAGSDGSPAAAGGSLANPLDEADDAPVSTGSQTWAVFVAVAAVIVCIALLVVQYMEWSHYHAPATAFPNFIPDMSAAPAPSVEETVEPMDSIDDTAIAE